MPATATPPSSVRLDRVPRRARTCMVPSAVAGQPGLVTVDATWGTIQPMALAPGVATIGELEVIEHLAAGGQLIDTRRPEFLESGTIPGSHAIPHTEIEERLGEMESERPVAFFCNGPQCAATPDAVRRLLSAGRKPSLILYYRGGIHDWMTLGLPLERSPGPGATSRRTDRANRPPVDRP